MFLRPTREITIFSFFVKGQLGCEYTLYIHRVYRLRGSPVFLLNFWFHLSLVRLDLLLFIFFYVFTWFQKDGHLFNYKDMLMVKWKQKIITLKDRMRKEWKKLMIIMINY